MLPFSLIYVVSSLFSFFIIVTNFEYFGVRFCLILLFQQLPLYQNGIYLYIEYDFFYYVILSGITLIKLSLDVNGMGIKQTHINQIEIRSLLLSDTLRLFFILFFYTYDI